MNLFLNAIKIQTKKDSNILKSKQIIANGIFFRRTTMFKNRQYQWNFEFWGIRWGNLFQQNFRQWISEILNMWFFLKFLMSLKNTIRFFTKFDEMLSSGTCTFPTEFFFLDVVSWFNCASMWNAVQPDEMHKSLANRLIFSRGNLRFMFGLHTNCRRNNR